MFLPLPPGVGYCSSIVGISLTSGSCLILTDSDAAKWDVTWTAETPATDYTTKPRDHVPSCAGVQGNQPTPENKAAGSESRKPGQLTRAPVTSDPQGHQVQKEESTAGQS